MSDESWTWDEELNPDVMGAVAAPADDLGWCDRLETAATDAIVGKVLCACAAMAIAWEVLKAHGDDDPQATDALELLARWIDDPTDERFDRICSLIFADEPPALGPEGVGWWALRTATSSVGNFEAGWALSSTCGAAQWAGFSPERLREIAERAVLARRRKVAFG